MLCQNGECGCLDVCTPGYTCASPPPGAYEPFIPCCGRPGCGCFTTTEGTAFCADSDQFGSDFYTAICEPTADCNAGEVCGGNELRGTIPSQARSVSRGVADGQDLGDME